MSDQDKPRCEHGIPIERLPTPHLCRSRHNWKKSLVAALRSLSEEERAQVIGELAVEEPVTCAYCRVAPAMPGEKTCERCSL